MNKKEIIHSSHNIDIKEISEYKGDSLTNFYVTVDNKNVLDEDGKIEPYIVDHMILLADRTLPNGVVKKMKKELRSIVEEYNDKV